jgi:hypothetical protein
MATMFDMRSHWTQDQVDNIVDRYRRMYKARYSVHCDDLDSSDIMQAFLVIAAYDDTAEQTDDAMLFCMAAMDKGGRYPRGWMVVQS